MWTEMFDHIFQDYVHWRRNYFPADPWIVGRLKRRSPEHESWLDTLTTQLDATLSELKFHFPLHSPRYNAHMVSEQSLPAVLGYFAGLLYNPNNVTSESAPITVALEIEVGRMIAAMLGYDPRQAWAHITSGGTIATTEALWVARSVQFTPLIVRDYCRANRLDFRIPLPNGTEAPATDIDDATLVALRPQDTLRLLRSLTRAAQAATGRPADEVVRRLNEYVSENRFNVSRQGLGTVLGATGLRPVVFATAAAHYSIAKACNVLGYGEAALRLVPVNDRFQLNADALGAALEALAPDEYVAAVIGVVGTTEEGAVDPIHRIRDIRSTLEKRRNRSFWLHVDAAWGGYFRTLFQGLPVAHMPNAGIETVAAEYSRALDLHQRFDVDVGTGGTSDIRTYETRWGDTDTCAAFLAMAEGDSTTVDPHKMGYIPYPAGVIAFRNGLVTEFITQRAQYLSDEPDGIGAFDQQQPPAFGPHILEGSKPGAAALACWLAHRTIPLTTDGHGKVVRTTLLSAQRFCRLLSAHQHLFARLEQQRGAAGPCPTPFTFMPVTEPETNIVCFLARPMQWHQGSMRPACVPLADINQLNQQIYAAASVPGARAHQTSTVQPFFVSRTRFEEQQYQAASLGPLLGRLGVGVEEYQREGLFVLRSTVMNPWHEEAQRAGIDYLSEFLAFLHRVTAEALTAGSASPSPSRASSSA
ncbi:MAG TPA: pyridoxal-dependent decarboxylase [Gemmatimonadales bacterium]|nr:pyridoxal-dependent decarboxylase [Gemmatimonadales bacterium]